ncbi:MAG: PorT family protein [Candidatus Paraprevotella stercoravium]|jgi:hypothetical protein|uniref:Outer membrane beta-barrel protein n=2 Tax=Bacteroidales TaxID=171549 RepID=A0ABT7U4U6_9BACE|nr:PorT family protein [Candidatus Paraprevotella stercoravium]MDM8145532.1 outer membrane beta-barrel protein [Bacteroides eggerthii]
MIKRIFSFLILLCMLPAGMGYIGINGNTTQAEGISASRWYNYDRSSYFGIRVGLNVPRFYCRGFNPGPETRPLSLINAGIVYGNRVGRTIPLYFETGLLYSEKGAKLEATKDIERKTYNLKYLELPIVFKYKADVGFDDLTIQPYFGGFIACGVGGNVKLYEQRIKENPFSDKYLKRFDAGFRLGLGMAFQNFYLDFCYDIGMNNLAGKDFKDYNYDDFDGRIRTGCFTASVGLDF